MNIALIKAGGTGTRMHAGIPKQFICVKDKPIIIYTLEAFENHPSVDGIIVVCLEGWHEVLRSYAKKFGIKKLIQVVNGGSTSLKSIQAGVNELKKRYSPEDTILIHDGNRPLISQDIISDVLAKCELYGSAVAAIPCTDEVMVTDAMPMESERFLDRKTLYRIQTPDAYKLGTLIELFEKASEEQLLTLGATNTLMISVGQKVHFAQGSEVNIRLTTQEDILLCEALLDLDSQRKTID